MPNKFGSIEHSNTNKMENKKLPTYGNGKICYIEIPSDDLIASMAFYKTVFNWTTRRRSDGSVAFDDAVGEVSGTWVFGKKPATNPEILIYIMVFNIKETIVVIETMGGKIILPESKIGSEIISKFSDPTGNVFGLYQQPN